MQRVSLFEAIAKESNNVQFTQLEPIVIKGVKQPLIPVEGGVVEFSP
jgi:hypothetical protein